MKNLIPKSILISVALLMAADFSHATTSVVKLNVGSNSNCNSLTTEPITQARDTNYTGGDNNICTTAGPFDSVSGPDRQIFEYQLCNGKKTIEWKVTNPDPVSSTTSKRVNYVLLKQQGNNPTIAVYYAQPGVHQDNGVTTDFSITGVTFCYGLPSQEISTSALQSCGPTTECANLQNQGIRERIITKFDELEDNSKNWKVSTCACDSGEPFVECDPNIPAGSIGACTKTPTLANPNDGILKFLPTSVELGLNPHSYYCTVIFGTKRCWSK